MEWYQKQFRRNLVDMHIEDWDPVFLSKFDPERYVELLKKGKIGAPMLYFQSHVGLCYWPTKTGKMHTAFIGREDAMKRVERGCHEAGMNVIGYYSLIYNNWAHQNHSDWRMVDAEGAHSRSDGSRYGLCCPNNLNYRAFTEQQIEELCAYFDFEGIFMDMLFWPMICHCPSCQARWEKEVGGPLPDKVDWHDQRWLTYQKKRSDWMGEYALWATATLQKYKPGVAVEHQYSTIMHDWRYGVNENMAIASTYAGGDLYGGIEQASFACKAYYNVTRSQPFEYMTSRCYPALNEHTTMKSLDMLKQSVAMTFLHHGACLLIDAIDPVGTMDERVYDRIGQVFDDLGRYEPWLTWGEQAYDVALYYDLNGKYNPEAPVVPVNDPKVDRSNPMQNALLGAARSLRAHHIPYGVVNNWQFDKFQKAKVLALCDVPAFEPDKVQKVLDFVRDGGGLYLSGHSSPELVKELFGLTFSGQTPEGVTYVAPEGEGAHLMDGLYTSDYPLVMFEPQMQATGTLKGEMLGSLVLPYTMPRMMECVDTKPGVEPGPFVSIHSNPPGIHTGKTAIAMVRYGKGVAAWNAAPIEKPDREQHAEIFARTISRLAGGSFAVRSDAPENVECVLFDVPEHGAKLVGLIDVQEAFRIQPVGGFTVSVRMDSAPKKAYLLPGGEPLPCEWANGWAKVRLEGLHIFSMFVVEC